MSEESIIKLSTPDDSLAPKQDSGYRTLKVKFTGNCSRQDSISFIYGNVVNLNIAIYCYIFIYLNTDFTLANCLLRTVKLTKNVDPSKYAYSG